MIRDASTPATSHERMIERALRVVKVDGGMVWAVPDSAGPCAGCASATRCGAGGSQTAHAIPIQALPSACTGDRVIVGLEAGALTEAALTAYGIPMTALLLAAGLAAAGSLGDALTAAASIAGLAAGMLIVRLRALRPLVHARLMPRVLASGGTTAESLP